VSIQPPGEHSLSGGFLLRCQAHLNNLPLYIQEERLATPEDEKSRNQKARHNAREL